ncbi:hypothetical protein QLS91_16570 [Flavobacterium sp. LB2P84]|uniref:DUF4294 domain-containing protein n=1 Tax=Flavobacterium yafengii TaxID=3041253 RepID=A0AAW6TKU3_9FLAO|nr:hypothetical protein [Flavobacterium yafengii]MDI5950216.1 hypothetical protein [Flavobacterium yafengii]MDI6034695.1 hypothetical protein [Flavobacterium yafengii]
MLYVSLVNNKTATIKNRFYIFFLFVIFTNCKDKTTETKENIEIPQLNIPDTKYDKKAVDYYRNEIESAVSLLVSQKQIINLELNKNERAVIIAIAFPEVLRYNSFSDLIETSSNRILYINGGKIASDFSIGYFQMKPSFVEDLEKFVANSENLEKYNSIVIQYKDEKKTRKERINRLENLQWQLRYLKVFWQVLDDKYKNIVFKNRDEKIRFYATAYNYGFLQSEKAIIKYQTIKVFPYGKNSKKKKLAFADFSIDFINTYLTLFNQ